MGQKLGSFLCDLRGEIHWMREHSRQRLAVACFFWQIGKMTGQGSTGNVIAALCSFFIPGLGQLLQGRWILALVMFVLASLLWLVLLGWLIHLWSIVDAACFRGPGI